MVGVFALRKPVAGRSLGDGIANALTAMPSNVAAARAKLVAAASSTSGVVFVYFVYFVVKFSPQMSDFETRFGGIARLYGKSGLDKLRAAHVCVVGIGGVGAWAAEALARSGVGALTLVDLDEVCATNINRQLHALTETVGRAKVEVMAERIRAINPDCRVMAEQKFFNAQTADELLSPQPWAAGIRGRSNFRWIFRQAARYDFVLDAIDSVTQQSAAAGAVPRKESAGRVLWRRGRTA